MKKLILGPLLILGIPQVLVSLFFLFVKAVLGWGQDARQGYVITTGIVLVITLLICAACLFDFDGSGGWINNYEAEQRKLTAQREKLQQRLDEEIGIPRIK